MTLSRWTYFKEAFFTAWNYAALGGLVFLGYFFRNPMYLIPAGLIEFGVLYSIASNKRFQRAIRAKHFGFFPVFDQDEIFRLKKLLDADHLRQFQRFETIYHQIRQTAENINSASSALLEMGLSKLDFLLNTYLKMLFFHQKYNEHLGQADRDRIMQQIGNIDREIQGRSGRILELKNKNKEILQQRLEKLDKARENREVIEAELEVMFNTINLLKDQSISMADPQGISEQIDTVLANMQDTEVLIREMDSLMAADTLPPMENDFLEPPYPTDRNTEKQ